MNIVNHPVRERIPVPAAALGPEDVEPAAEIAEGRQHAFVQSSSEMEMARPS